MNTSAIATVLGSALLSILKKSGGKSKFGMIRENYLQVRTEDPTHLYYIDATVEPIWDNNILVNRLEIMEIFSNAQQKLNSYANSTAFKEMLPSFKEEVIGEIEEYSEQQESEEQYSEEQILIQHKSSLEIKVSLELSDFTFFENSQAYYPPEYRVKVLDQIPVYVFVEFIRRAESPKSYPQDIVFNPNNQKDIDNIKKMYYLVLDSIDTNILHHTSDGENIEIGDVIYGREKASYEKYGEWFPYEVKTPKASKLRKR